MWHLTWIMQNEEESTGWWAKDTFLMREKCLWNHTTEKMHGMFKELERTVWVDYSPHVCMCIYEHAHVWGQEWTSVHTYTHVISYVYLSMYFSVHVYMWPYACAYLYIHGTNIHINTCVYVLLCVTRVHVLRTCMHVWQLNSDGSRKCQAEKGKGAVLDVLDMTT